MPSPDQAVGINAIPLQISNSNCDNPSPPCFPCPPTEVENTKADFYQTKSAWLSAKAALPYITDAGQRKAKEAQIEDLRRTMNRDGSWILMNYEQDTTEIRTDSILVWLDLIQTFETDLTLARHYFFNAQLAAFDSVWYRAGTEYELDSTYISIYNHLDEVYDYLYPYQQAGADLDALPESAIAFLEGYIVNCDESAYLSKILLRRNGVSAELVCDQVEERNMSVHAGKIPKEQKLIVVPNPADNLLLLQFNKLSVPGMISIVDAFGRIVKEIALDSGIEQYDVQTGVFPAGLYFIQLKSGFQISTSRVLISH